MRERERIGSVYKKPLEDNEQPADTQISYLRQRRKQTIPNRYSVNDNHPDEHSEIPRIRRASLPLNAQNGKEASQQLGKKPTPPQLHRETGRLPIAKPSQEASDEEIGDQ